MATGTIQLQVGAATPPDGSASNAAAAIQSYKGTNTAPARFGLRGLFDATTQEHLWWTFTAPNNYASGGTVRILWAANATTNAVVWGCSVGAVTAADADTYLEHVQATASTTTTNVNATEARRITETTISPSVDSMAANDLVTIVIYRAAANGSDTCTVDAEYVSGVFEFTTT